MTRGEAAPERLTTAAVSTATGYSVQQIRDLEALKVISPAPRAGNGYRRFAATHVRDLRAYRDLATAIGPVDARRAMREIRSLPPDEAASLVSSFHSALDREREGALAAQQALRAIRAEAEAESAPDGGGGNGGAEGDGDGDAMTITELADALGVRTSTLRFWEKSGLLTPERVTTRAGSARRYPLPAIREARIVAALRAAGYRIPDARDAVTALRDLRDIGRSLRALDSRIDAIAQRTLALLRAGAILHEIIANRPPGQAR